MAQDTRIPLQTLPSLRGKRLEPTPSEGRGGEQVWQALGELGSGGSSPPRPTSSRKRAGSQRVPLARSLVRQSSVSVPGEKRAVRGPTASPRQPEPGDCRPLSIPEPRGRPPLHARGQERRGASSQHSPRGGRHARRVLEVTWSAASAEPAWLLTRRTGRGREGRGFRGSVGRGRRPQVPPPPAPDCTPRRGGALEGGD